MLTQERLINNRTDIKILDKISSKNELVKLINGDETQYTKIFL